MHRRELSSALLIAATGATFHSSPADAQQKSAADSLRSPAELRAGVEPHLSQYPEGDIRRYGASPTADDNSSAINMALLVSSCGGSAVFIPAGVWKIEKTIEIVGAASMFGVGNGSVIAANSCDGLAFGDGGNYAKAGTARFMRDFQLIGSDPHSSTYKGIRVDFSAASQVRVTGVNFDNLYISNFGTAIYLRGLYNSNFNNCFIYNNYYGFYFYGQAITTSITNCNIQRGIIGGQGGAWGVSFQAIDGESTENTHISGGQVYGYDININVGLAFELQIEHCDISEAQSIGIQITSTNGGLWVRDCWIETAKSAVTTGILVNDIRPSVHAKVNITGNYITCDMPHAGSEGINIGNSNAGILVNENQIYGFDRGVTLGASANLTCKFNTININSPVYSASSYALLLNTLATDSEIGPNYVVPGAKRSATADGTTRITVDSAAPPLPVGTPVQFDTSALGFLKDVTYFVVGALGNTISVATSPGNRPIAARGSGSIGAVFAEPLPMAFTAGTPAGLSFHGRGSFIVELGGFAAAVSGVVNWAVSGRSIALSVGSESGLTEESNSTELHASGIPRFLLPSGAQLFAASVINSGKCVWGAGKLTPSGMLVFYATPDRGAFEASGRKGLGSAVISYLFS